MEKFREIVDINKKIVIFGGCGFIGSNISCILANLGNNILIIDNLSNGKVENINEIIDMPNVKFLELDINNYELVVESTKGYDYFIQQAAYGSVPRSIAFPELYISNNEVGTFNVFKAAIENNIEAVVYASSSSVYGDHHALPKVEEVTGNVLSPYALSKKHNEDYASIFAKLYNLNVVGLRYFNIFGPKQRLDSPYAAVIPLFTNWIDDNKDVLVNGDGLQSRDFTYIDNAILANLLALKHASKHKGEVYNVACGDQVILNDIIVKIENILEKNSNVIHRDEREGDVRHSEASLVKIHNDFGYSPIVRFDEGLEKTVEFYVNKEENL